MGKGLAAVLLNGVIGGIGTCFGLAIGSKIVNKIRNAGMIRRAHYKY